MAKSKSGRTLTVRLNVLFLLTFLLFSMLIFRLGFIQIVHGEEYREKSERQSVRKVSVEAPRGWMLDRNGDILVYNVPVYTVTYTESNQLGTEEKEEVAQLLSTLIDYDADQILTRMNQAVAFVPQRIKTDLTLDEVARVEEHKDQLSGVDVMIDSKRAYKYDNIFSTYIGKVGYIPAEQLSEYLSKGYRMNEFVGTSYLEKQYEEQLRGTEGVIEVTVDSKRRPVGDPVLTDGKRGNDLILTIDVNLQKKIEEVIAKTIEENELVKEAYFVAMDPNTGEILGMSNDHRTVGAGSFSYAMGSTVKMASALMGLHEGIVTPETVIMDQPVTIGNITKSSWKNLGPVNVYSALQRSSNVYMFNIGLKMAERYGRIEAFDKVYEYFSQFGLGVKTGIDLPEGVEYEGYKSSSTLPGLLADFTIGQYHNYTPLQMVQYVSTIANGGYRLQPYLVREIRSGVRSDGDLGQLVWKKEPTVLNRIEMSEEHIEVVQKGMELVTEPNGTAYSMFGSFPVKVASKTGTAQTVNPDGTPGLNHTIFVGYAPADDPQIAFAAITPWSQESRSQGQVSYAQVITKEILSYYFGLDQSGE